MYIDTLEGSKFPHWAKNFIITVLNDHRRQLPKLWKWAQAVYSRYHNLIDDEGQMLVEFSPQIDIRKIFPSNYSRKCQGNNKPNIIPYDQVLNLVTAQFPITKYSYNGVIYFITCKNKYIHINRYNIPCCSPTIPHDKMTGIELNQEDISQVYRLSNLIKGKVMYMSGSLPIYADLSLAGKFAYIDGTKPDFYFGIFII